MTRIYTRQGDDGDSVLFDGTRVPKNHLRLETVGTIDELNSHLGLAASQCLHADLKEQLLTLQSRLLTLGADLATPLGSPNESRVRRMGPADIADLERWIDGAAARLPALRRFVLPGGGLTAARLHVARTVCRRAERLLVALKLLPPPEGVGSEPLIYLNRLSDLLFVLARLANQLDGIDETQWTPAD